MAKQKKNSNYVTEKNIAKQEAKEEQKRKEKQAKTAKIVAISVGSSIAAIAIIIGILFAIGVFDYYPEGTYDATITFDDGTSLHIELYGNDAPKTVENFIKLCNSGYFKGKSAHAFLNDMLYIGAESADGGKNGITGEFDANGFKNKIKLEKGVLCMARGAGNNSAYGQFFILTKDAPKSQGNFAAFGKVSDLAALEKLIDSIKTDDKGNIIDAPVITNVSTHEAHDH